MVELFEQDERQNNRQSSKGNQLKWKNNGMWYKAAHGWRRCCPHRHHPCTSALRTVRLITKQGGNRLWTAYSNRSQTG